VKLYFFDECSNEPSKPWLIKDVIACDEDSLWFGAPGSLKSSLLTDIAVHLAAGTDWRGHKIKASAGVVYFAFERAGLTRRRLAAHAKRDGLKNLPVAVAGDIIDLIDQGCAEMILGGIKEAEARFGVPVGLIILDTYAKGIAAGGGDEDKAQHANIVAANLKLVHEGTAHKLHIALIGHTGWDGQRERGSSALRGHIDLAVQVAANTTKTVMTAKVVKANDQAEETLTTFGAETITVGHDEDGTPRTANIVATRAVREALKEKPTSFKHIRALDGLKRVLGIDGRDVETAAGATVKGVALEQWKAELIEIGVIDPNAANKRDAFARIKNAMVSEKLIEERSGFVWPLQQAGGGIFSSLQFPVPSPSIQPPPLPYFPGQPSSLPPSQSAGPIGPCDALRR
jgi:AAA domain